MDAFRKRRERRDGGEGILVCNKLRATRQGRAVSKFDGSPGLRSHETAQDQVPPPRNLQLLTSLPRRPVDPTTVWRPLAFAVAFKFRPQVILFSDGSAG